MKYKNKYDIGDRVHCIFTKDVLEIIQVMSRNTWIDEVPSLFIEFLNDNYDAKRHRNCPNDSSWVFDFKGVLHKSCNFWRKANLLLSPKLFRPQIPAAVHLPVVPGCG